MKWIGRMKSALRPKATGGVVRETTGSLPDDDRLQSLTPREREVLSMLVQGMKQREVARCLDVQPTTVSFHTQSLYRKLGVHDRAQLILRYALPVGAQVSHPTKEGEEA